MTRSRRYRNVKLSLIVIVTTSDSLPNVTQFPPSTICYLMYELSLSFYNRLHSYIVLLVLVLNLSTTRTLVCRISVSVLIRSLVLSHPTRFPFMFCDPSIFLQCSRRTYSILIQRILFSTNPNVIFQLIQTSVAQSWDRRVI